MQTTNHISFPILLISLITSIPVMIESVCYPKMATSIFFFKWVIFRYMLQEKSIEIIHMESWKRTALMMILFSTKNHYKTNCLDYVFRWRKWWNYTFSVKKSCIYIITFSDLLYLRKQVPSKDVAKTKKKKKLWIV